MPGPIQSHDPTASRRLGRVPALQPLPLRSAVPTLTTTLPHALAADARHRTAERQGSAPPVTALAPGAGIDETALAATLADLTTTARQQAAAIDATSKDLTSGNAVARGFNAMVNVFTHKQDHLESQRQTAVRALRSTLPGDLETFHHLITAAGDDPVKQQAATTFLQTALARTQQAVDSYNDKATDLSKSNKFWSGIASDTLAGIGVAVGVGLCLTGAGATVGAPLIAASFAGGGALSLGGHALLDNQFDLKKEGLGTFVVGGLSGVATAVTAGASNAVAGRLSAGAARVFGANAVKGAVVQGGIMAAARGLTNGVVGATITGAQQLVDERARGYQPGAAQRILKAAGSGAVGGFVGGALWSGVSSALDAAVPAAMSRLPGGLSSRVSSVSDRVMASGTGRVAWNTLSGAFYGGPVGAAGTALAGWMTGEPLTKEEFWHQVVGGAINGGAVYGTWAATPGGRTDLESSGSYALDKPGRRSTPFRRLKVTVADLRLKTPSRMPDSGKRSVGNGHPTPPVRPAKPRSPVTSVRKGPAEGPRRVRVGQRPWATLRQRIAVPLIERRHALSDDELKRIHLDRGSLLPQ